MGSFVELAAADGHRFAAWQATPQGKARGAVVLAPEIFGVNSHIRAVTDGYAADGYLAIAPALFDRVQRNYETGYASDEIQAGVAIMQRIAFDAALKDVAAAIAHGTAAGRVAIVGYCWGGTVAWLAAARLTGLAAAVPYYGGGMPNHADESPQCPVLCHFGERDKSPSPAQARALLARHPEVAAHFYDAGHGFNCDQRPSYDAAASGLARTRTLAFLAQHVG
ncbi:MAG: dienelactone hydrolase family protein [Burkholderiaceae bacterium]|nr:dienelactone hydrolase family protein [Burkholderiaceae bacterium]MEB2351639.1 dienelactone hydrolase family protein [Burkholderiaceae bacterium]